MTREASGAQFEIKVDGVSRTYRDFRETAIEAAPVPAAAARRQDNRDRRARGSTVTFERGS